MSHKRRSGWCTAIPCRAHLFGAPFTADWTALSFFAGSDLDSIARLAMALAGVATLLMLISFQSWWGSRFVTVAAVLAALSPTLIRFGTTR